MPNPSSNAPEASPKTRKPSPQPGDPEVNLDVLGMIGELERNIRLIKSSAAGYSHLRRMLEGGVSTDAAALPQPPLMVWPARFGSSETVEVTTDLSNLDAARLQAVASPMIDLHALDMYHAATLIHRISGQLCHILQQSIAAEDAKSPPNDEDEGS